MTFVTQYLFYLSFEIFFSIYRLYIPNKHTFLLIAVSLYSTICQSKTWLKIIKHKNDIKVSIIISIQIKLNNNKN